MATTRRSQRGPKSASMLLTKTTKRQTSVASKITQLRAIIGSDASESELLRLLKSANFKVESAVNKFFNSSSTLEETDISAGNSRPAAAAAGPAMDKKKDGDASTAELTRTKPKRRASNPVQTVIEIGSESDSDFECCELLSDVSNSADDVPKTKKSRKAKESGSQIRKRKVIDLSIAHPSTHGASSDWAARVKSSVQRRKEARKKLSTQAGTSLLGEPRDNDVDGVCQHGFGPECTACASKGNVTNSNEWARLGRRLIEGASLMRGRCPWKLGSSFVVWPDKVDVPVADASAHSSAQGASKKKPKKNRASNLFGSGNGRQKKTKDFVRFGLVRDKAVGRFDTGPAASLALLMNAGMVRVAGDAYNCPSTLWMLTPVHVLLTVHIRKTAMQQLEWQNCPDRIRLAIFELMAFFFPKVNVFRNVKDSAEQTKIEERSASSSASPTSLSSKKNSSMASGGPEEHEVDSEKAKAAAAISDSCTELIVRDGLGVHLPDELETAVARGLKVGTTMHLSCLLGFRSVASVGASCFESDCCPLLLGPHGETASLSAPCPSVDVAAGTNAGAYRVLKR